MDDSEWVYNEDDGDIESASEDVLDLLDGSEYESLSVCESALLDDEALLGLRSDGGDVVAGVEAVVKLEEPVMAVTKRRRVYTDRDDGQDTGRVKSNIIRLDGKGKFRYVPDRLPEVELPELAKKRSRWSPTKKRRKMLTEPTLLLDPQSQPNSELQSAHKLRSLDGVVDLRSVLLANRKNQSPSLDNTTSAVEPDSTCSTTDSCANFTTTVANTTDPVCESTLPDPSNGLEQSSAYKQVSVQSSLTMSTSSSPCLTPVKSETVVTAKSSSVGSLQNIFAFRPSFFSRAPPTQFSLQHLITSSPSHFTFSLDHLRS